jgi:hypothetical protein
MPLEPSKPSAHTLYERSRQKVLLLVLSGVLMAGGLVILFLLKRMPLPMRLLVGLGDVVAASALLLILRQKFSAS